jgi:hypothetical protein
MHVQEMLRVGIGMIINNIYIYWNKFPTCQYEILIPQFANISLLKKFRFAQSDEKILRENNLPIQTYTANIWRVIDMYENNIFFVARIFLTQNFMD